MILRSLSWTSAITGMGALLITLMLLFGLVAGRLEGPEGIAIVALGVWPVGLTVIGLVAGFAAYFLASGARVPLPGPGKAGLWAAGTSGTILALAMFLA